MPNQTDECVASVLNDDPEKSESEAYAICKAQKEGFDLDEIEAEALSDVGGGLESQSDTDLSVEQSLDQLAESDHTPWIRETTEQAVAWVDTDSGAVVYQERESNQQGAVLVKGLSQEARESIEATYNVEVTDHE